MENMVNKLNEKAIDILKGELEKEHSPMVPGVPIINYLIDKCEKDENFADRITLENKNLKECLEYVLQEVKKKLNGKNGYIPDQEVYNIAETYYLLDEVKIEKPETKAIDIPKTKNKTNNKVTVQTNQTKKNKLPQKEQLSLFDF